MTTCCLPWWKKCLPCVLLVCALITGKENALQAQEPADPQQQLQRLLKQYQEQQLDDTSYLQAVHTVALQLQNNDSLEQWLATYHQVAFSKPEYARYRAYYYRHLQNLADNKSRYGSAIYYSEKATEERIKAGILNKEQLSPSHLFAIAVYIENKDYARVFSKYQSLRPFIMAMPEKIMAGEKAATPDGVGTVFGILDIVALAASRTNDTARVIDAIHQCEALLKEINQQPEKYSHYLIYYSFIHHCVRFYAENFLQHTEKAQELLQVCFSEVRTPAFAKVKDQEGYTLDMYIEAFDFYCRLHRYDSAQHYLNLIKNMEDPDGELMNDMASFWLDGTSKLEAGKGGYEAAYQHLRKAFDMQVAAFYAVSADKENNLYALTRAEDLHHDLLRAEKEKNQARIFTNFLFAVLGLLLLTSITVLLIYRSKQRRRLLNLQLGLARNFHDEIGPMVLYASTLAKKELETHRSAGLEELKGQMKQIMETVRGIAIDLKSNRLNTIHDFYEELTALLERIKASTQIDYNMGLQNGNAVLSHLQYDNLRKMISELITNSIKHADCTLLSLQMRVKDRNLRINYSDNGKGIPEEQLFNESKPLKTRATATEAEETAQPVQGIGLQNIRERVELLKGKLQWNNYYPEGYSVTIIIPLL